MRLRRRAARPQAAQVVPLQRQTSGKTGMNFLSSTRDTVANDLVQRAMHPSKTEVTSYPVLRAQHGARTVPETQLVLTECS